MKNWENNTQKQHFPGIFQNSYFEKSGDFT